MIENNCDPHHYQHFMLKPGADPSGRLEAGMIFGTEGEALMMVIMMIEVMTMI